MPEAAGFTTLALIAIEIGLFSRKVAKIAEGDFFRGNVSLPYIAIDIGNTCYQQYAPLLG